MAKKKRMKIFIVKTVFLKKQHFKNTKLRSIIQIRNN